MNRSSLMMLALSFAGACAFAQTNPVIAGAEDRIYENNRTT